MLRQTDFQGNPFIGVFCVCSDKVAFVPEQAEDSFINLIEEALALEVARLSIDGSPLLGSLVVMNSKGAVAADFATRSDVDKMSPWVDVTRIEDLLNAVGNNIVANDNGALVHPEVSDETLALISEALKVDAARGTVGEMKTVGACAVSTNKGVLVHPRVSEEEKEVMEELFNVSIGVGTANFGSPLLGAAMVCNSQGGLAGSKTTGVELNRIEDVLELY